MILTRLLTITTLILITPLTTAKISLSQIPGPATIGQPSTIKWSGGDGSPVTLFLLEGKLPSPKTVDIIASNIQGDSYSWTPDSKLPAGDDYLLEITQGLSDINYSGQFSLQTAAAAAAASATTIYAVAGSSTIAISTVSPGMNTSTVTLQPVSSATAASSAAGASASGTGGISMARNTTFVSQSLTATRNLTVGTSTATVTTAGTTTTAGAVVSTTDSAGSSSTSSSVGGAVAAVATAQGVLGFGAMAAAAVVYLL